MDILTRLLTFPVTGPVEGLVWIAEKLTEQAEAELYDEDAVRGRLMELELKRDMGEISDEEHLAAEDDLLALLREIRERKAARQRT